MNIDKRVGGSIKTDICLFENRLLEKGQIIYLIGKFYSFSVKWLYINPPNPLVIVSHYH